MQDEAAHQMLGIGKHAVSIPCQVVYGVDTDMYLPHRTVFGAERLCWQWQ